MTTFKDPFSEEVWMSTYKDHRDNSIDDTFKRVAKAVASIESPELQQKWENEFYDMLSDFKVVSGGRIMANAGTGWGGTTLMNCYVTPMPSYDADSLGGILEVLRNQAFTLKSEGGWGCNFSWIRPRGAFIHGIGVETPGSVKFMEVFDKTSSIITEGSGLDRSNAKAKGKIRKGAMMAVLDCFAKDTEILTNEGIQTLEKICEERNPNLKAITENNEEYPISDWIINPPSQLYEVEDEEGNKVKVTADHKFMVYNIQTDKEYLKPLKDINPETEMLIRIE
jgi:ribonucleotide reductase alpha subunit